MPNECGKKTCLSISTLCPSPIPNAVLAKSPKPSIEAGGLFETRNQIDRREMREVVLDVVGLRLSLDPVKLLERFLDRCGAPDVLDFLSHQLRMWPTCENESE